MLDAQDRSAGLEAGFSQTRVAHLIGRSPSVERRAITRLASPDGVYLTEDARYWAQRVGQDSIPGIVEGASSGAASSG